MQSLSLLLAQLPADITVGAYENVYFHLRRDLEDDYLCEALSSKGRTYDTVFADMEGMEDQPIFFLRSSPHAAVEAMLEWLRTNGYKS